MRNRVLRLLVVPFVVVAGLVLFGAPAGAQGETTTTQLDIGGGGETTTTQLDIGGDGAPTEGADTPPNRVDAGAGGAATNEATPIALATLAGGLIVVIAAAARRVRA